MNKRDPQEPKRADERNEVEGAEEGKAKALSAEEQMALYEDDLKESDWGHQPC